MSDKEIILVGGGGHAIACIDVIKSCNKYKIIGYLDKERTLDDKYCVPYLGDDIFFENYIKSAYFLICVGQIKNSEIRFNLFKMLAAKSARFVTIISPHAYVSPTSEVGEGTIIMHGVIVQSGSVIGKNCIINDKSLIEHNTIIGNHVHVSTGAILNGQVNVGSRVFIGSGSVIKNGIVVKDKSIIGMGSVVVENVNESQIVIGNPAKPIVND